MQDVKNVSLTIPLTDLPRFEQLAQKLSRRVEGLAVSRAETIRLCAQKGLEVFEQEERELDSVLDEAPGAS